jgi:hypothetical protein
MPAEYHWGFWVTSDTPTTGVFSNHGLEFIFEDADAGDDPDWEEFAEERTEDELEDCWDYQQSTAYIGMVRGEDGKWSDDPGAEYSAIVSFDGMNITQVVKSQWLIRGALCSPCCPGQVDADSPGEYLGYSVPPEVVGDNDPELKSRIFLASFAGAIGARK